MRNRSDTQSEWEIDQSRIFDHTTTKTSYTEFFLPYSNAKRSQQTAIGQIRADSLGVSKIVSLQSFYVIGVWAILGAIMIIKMH